jgi:hypothetical protein
MASYRLKMRIVEFGRCTADGGIRGARATAGTVDQGLSLEDATAMASFPYNGVPQRGDRVGTMRALDAEVLAAHGSPAWVSARRSISSTHGEDG